MKLTPVSAIIGAIAALGMAACSADSNAREDNGAESTPTHGGTRNFAVSGFTGISLGGLDNVTAKTGSSFSIVAQGNDADLDDLEVRLDGDNLLIKRKSSGIGLRKSRPVAITVTMPKIENLALGGSGTIKADHVTGSNAALSIGGSGTIDVAKLEAASADISVGGSGDVTAAGKVPTLTLSVAGSGNAKLANLASDTATMSVAGSGNIDSSVAKDATINIVGSGNVTVAGGAKCAVTKMGSGTVRCPAS